MEREISNDGYFQKSRASNLLDEIVSVRGLNLRNLRQPLTFMEDNAHLPSKYTWVKDTKKPFKVSDLYNILTKYGDARKDFIDHFPGRYLSNIQTNLLKNNSSVEKGLMPTLPIVFVSKGKIKEQIELIDFKNDITSKVQMISSLEINPYKDESIEMGSYLKKLANEETNQSLAGTLVDNLKSESPSLKTYCREKYVEISFVEDLMNPKIRNLTDRDIMEILGDQTVSEQELNIILNKSNLNEDLSEKASKLAKLGMGPSREIVNQLHEYLAKHSHTRISSAKTEEKCKLFEACLEKINEGNLDDAISAISGDLASPKSKLKARRDIFHVLKRRKPSSQELAEGLTKNTRR